MAKQPGRRGSARSHSLRKAGYALVTIGVVVVAVALWATTTRIEAASIGLVLIGGPLILLGGVLMGLDWMSSYTAASEGSWDHHVNPSRAAPARGAAARRGGRDGKRSRGRRRGLFGRGHPPSEFVDSVDGASTLEHSLTMNASASAPPLDAPPGSLVGPTTCPTAESGDRVAAAAGIEPKSADVVVVAVAPAVTLPSPTPTVPSVGSPDLAEVSTKSVKEPEKRFRSRSFPGPDTVVEEFVGYEGQDRMLAVREIAPQLPRELAWPNPPQQALDITAEGNETFLEKLMDDVLAKIRTVEDMAPAPSASKAGATADSRGESAWAPHAVLETTTPTWTPQTLHDADHWRFAALVEKLYQQAGFATQLQAGQTMPGVVVLWLFSRHRPGMPASVVRCVHAPGRPLSAAEILAVADLVTARGLPRGQLATTASVDEASRQLAAAQQVHVMDTQRLLELITRRTAEQQRVLATRLA